jgi:Tol biopolymer transport system component
VSGYGTLLFASRTPELQRLAWVDRDGEVQGHVGPSAASLSDPAVSPDGKQVLVMQAERDTQDAWVIDIASGRRTRTTFEGFVYKASWSPTGDRIAYSDELGVISVGPASGGETPRPLIVSEAGEFAPDWSPDGRHVVYYAIDPQTQRDLWYLTLDEGGEPLPFLRTPANEALPQFSPSGDYVAYQSTESGRWEVLVRPFPEGDERWQVSVDGGERPRWSPRGGELFYIEGDRLMAVPIRTQGGFQAGTPRPLFSGAQIGTELNPPINFFTDYYDVGADGRGFLVVQGLGQGANQMVLVQGPLLRAPADGGSAPEDAAR